jgi:hypothetical protein
MDLQSFFDHVRIEHLVGKIPEKYMRHVLIDGAARQGLPTSPAAANVAATDLDADIVAELDGNGRYTRYADDLTISSDSSLVIDMLRHRIPGLARRYGWTIHPDKTHVQHAAAGRRIITGIAVDSAIRPTRRTRRRLRAARHQYALTQQTTNAQRQERHRSNQARRRLGLSTRPALPQTTLAEVRGLEEWAACKLPNGTQFRAIGRGTASSAPAHAPPTTTAPTTQRGARRLKMGTT